MSNAILSPKPKNHGSHLFRKARLKRGLTQEAVSKLLGIRQALTSSYETGRHTPRPQTALVIQKKLGVPVESWQ